MQPPKAPDDGRDQRQELPVDAGLQAERGEREGVGGDDADAEREGGEADLDVRRDLAADGAEPDEADGERHRPGGQRVDAVVAEREGQRLGGDADDLRTTRCRATAPSAAPSSQRQPVRVRSTRTRRARSRAT